MYYERRLLAVAYNRMDRYIAIRYKGLGASKVNDEDINKSDNNDFFYLVKSKLSNHHYEIDGLVLVLEQLAFQVVNPVNISML